MCAGTYLLSFFCVCLVLQGSEHPRASDRSGGLDRQGSVYRQRGAKRHPLVLPPVETEAEIPQETRQRPAADVSNENTHTHTYL